MYIRRFNTLIFPFLCFSLSLSLCITSKSHGSHNVKTCSKRTKDRERNLSIPLKVIKPQRKRAREEERNKEKAQKQPEKINNMVISTRMLAKLLLSCLTLCDSMDYNWPGSSVHRALQERTWSALPCSLPGDLNDLGLNLCLSCLLHWQADSLPLVPPREPQ